MTREEIIEAIFYNKERAIGLGFDWPENDETENVSTETLTEFLQELEEFLEREQLLIPVSGRMNYSLKGNEMNAIEALKLIAETEFSPVTEADRQGLAGLESENPLIGYSADDWQIVIDGETVQFEREGNWFIFNLSLTFEG